MQTTLQKVILAMAALLLLPVSPAAEQKRRPIDKPGLMEAVRLKGLTTDQMVEVVREFGVDFRPTAEDEKELGRLGADPRLVEAVRSNYRAAPEPVAPPPVSLPAGPPLTRNQLILLLQARVDGGVVQKLVEKRGVDFPMNRGLAGELLAAGGNNALVGLITINHRDAPAVKKETPTPAQAAPAAPPAPVAAAPVRPAEPARVPAAQQSLKLLRKTMPEYPVMAARMGISGTVKLMVLIAATGAVKQVRVVSGQPMLVTAASEAVLTWQYQPTLVDGQPVEVVTEVDVTFTLKR